MTIAIIALWVFHLASGGREDCYGFLGVGKKDETKAIKSAYRKLAAKMHPDKNKDDPDATSKFQDLAWCNDVLKDEKKRKLYNRGGEKAVNEGGDDSSPFGGSPFSSFFGNQGEEEVQKGQTIILPLIVTLEELYNGEVIDILHTRRHYVETGGDRECKCRLEMRQKRQGHQTVIYQQRICEKCPNVKLESDDEELEIKIERGMKHGEEIDYYGEGEPLIDAESGDLKIVLQLQNHQIFERRGHDLYTNLTISLEAALTGFETQIKHLDGHIVTIKRDAITRHGHQHQVRREGMPVLTDNTLFGSLWVTFDVIFPSMELSEAERETIRKITRQSVQTPKMYNGINPPKMNFDE